MHGVREGSRRTVISPNRRQIVRNQRRTETVSSRLSLSVLELPGVFDCAAEPGNDGSFVGAMAPMLQLRSLESIGRTRVSGAVFVTVIGHVGRGRKKKKSVH
jgi:hypothetical protein